MELRETHAVREKLELPEVFNVIYYTFFMRIFNQKTECKAILHAPVMVPFQNFIGSTQI